MSLGKILIISREGGDFSIDLIFAGLVRKFGIEKIVDYPPRKKHRVGLPKLIGEHEKDYGAERSSLCYVEGCHLMPELGRLRIINEAHRGNFDLVFLDETAESYQSYLEIFSAIPISRQTHRVVVVAGHDRFRGEPQDVLDRFGPRLAAMFVDDWKQEYSSLKLTHLINLSSNFDHLWNVNDREQLLTNKHFDLCFAGYNSRPVRKIVIDHVKQNWWHLNNYIIFEERRDEFSAFVRHSDFFEKMAQSKICLNLSGASSGGRALRFYEIPYVGSYMLSMNFGAALLHPFIDGQHCGYFSTLDDLDKQINWALSHPVEREMIADAGKKFAAQYHTVDARIDYVFGVIG